MKCVDSYPPFHPNCRCVYPEFIILDDDDGGEEIQEKKYFIIIYRKVRKKWG